MDEWDSMGHGMKIDRRSSEWGDLSLRIAGFFLVMSPVQTFFNDFYWVIGLKGAAGLAPGEVQQLQVVTPIMTIVFLGLIAFGIFAGFRGMSLARVSGQPMARSLGGVIIGFVVFPIWLALGINMMAIVGMFK